MGMRPPTNGGATEPTSIEFGIAAVDAVLENDVQFPTTASELIAEHGEVEVPVDAAGNKLSLGDAVVRCEREEYPSRQALLNELHPVFEEERRRRASSIVGRIRSLVPF